VFDQVIFSIAIVYSQSLFAETKELDQHALISFISAIIAIMSKRLHSKWNAGTTAKAKAKAKEEKKKILSDIWRKIVAQWLKILQMISTFIAIHNLVDLVNNMILNTERFYHEAFLFPVITIMFSIAAVTLLDHHFFSV